MKDQNYAYYQSPLGIIELISNKDYLISCNFIQKAKKEVESVKSQILDITIKQLDEYFKGIRKNFQINLSISGTDFQKRVYNELQKIPFGEVISYTELAKRIGNEKAIRAVGSANGKNPISIIIPCHRVIGRDGNLRGYGGGIEKKKWLLDFERKNRDHVNY
ncbi:MAG TPA: methylated-DNA--[protein]-cysteine S-methyltransferase [candidate division Zixibacteria bacterium]|nr:methylated-DNA--[protein]-cysteine S-methyltransferase [candidate division Zixibacteria bacterium]